MRLIPISIQGCCLLPWILVTFYYSTKGCFLTSNALRQQLWLFDGICGFRYAGLIIHPLILKAGSYRALQQHLSSTFSAVHIHKNPWATSQGRDGSTLYR